MNAPVERAVDGEGGGWGRLCLPVALHNAKGQKKGDSLRGMAHEAGSYASSSPHCRQEVFLPPPATAGCSGMFIKHTTK